MSESDFKKFRNQILTTVIAGMFLMIITGMVGFVKTSAQVENNIINIDKNEQQIEKVKDCSFTTSEFLIFKKDLFRVLDKLEDKIDKLN